MRFATLLLFAALLAPLTSAQVVINEVDSDTPGTDAAEFVELYNAGSEPVDLSSYVLVLYNGNGAVSYGAYDLTGTLAAGDYFVVGNPDVPNVDLTVDPGGSGAIQNGADGVALYTGSAADFPDATPATSTNLVDAVVYGTGDDDATDLLSALGESTQYDESLNGDKDNESVQRSPDGADTFVTATATPGAQNALAAPETFLALLLGANEVPPVDTDAAGGVTAVLTGTEVVVTGRFDGLESDYATAIGSHLHGGPAGANGPVRYVLSPTLDADNRGGMFEADNNTFTVRSTFADSIRTGLVYVNIHTADNNGGEIRGQLLEDAPDAPEVTLAQARAIGSGFNVTVEGTVSRALGAFTYIQTEDAGLTIRQTSGDFFTGVGDGTIQPGTEVTVTGMLSEFNGLLQINGGALESYTVGDTGDAPDAVEVTLAEIAANGEEYEGRLVTVVGVLFADTGSFETNSNYSISDASSSSNAVDARVTSGADDTNIEGTAIPTVVTDVTGVVTEFSGDYQILLFEPSDLVISTDGEAGPEADGFSLRVVNPARAGAAVTLVAPVAADATVELFDVVGRRVATLADGTVAGEQTLRLSDSLAPGVYVLRLTTDAGSYAQTITVVR